ncbi:MAG: S8 family serine peptidase [Paracoccaceae bacterium]|nr:S8 family serine peptidase [Paracoccaceae bacterium]
MGRFFPFLSLLAGLAASCAWANVARDARVDIVLGAVDALCHRAELSGLDAQTAVPGSWLIEEAQRPSEGDPRVITVRLVLPGGDELTIERRQINGTLRQFRVALAAELGDGPTPNLLAIADGGCWVQSGRELRFGDEPWAYLDQLDGDLATVRWTETLQAPWPDGVDRGGVRVGLVDSGLAYDLPVFRDRLARSPGGQPLGYDFWDLDPWPYDGDTSRGAFLPIRHGTAVASILAREAPGADLVPYRYPRPDMARMGDIVAHAAAAGVRIMAMPLGSRDRADWATFEAALARHDMLAVVSAGNNGRDIDADPIYPAALPSERVLTVTSADDFGHLAHGSNWGAEHVDIMLPAEDLEVIDFRGERGRASGSSFAVPRLAAMAARILAREPDLTAVQLRARLLAEARPSPFERDGVLAGGWIPNPLEE